MKLRFTLLALSVLLLGTKFSYAQIDSTRNHEIRISYVGQSHFTPNFDERLLPDPPFADFSAAYLHRIRSGKYLLKAELSSRVGIGHKMISAGDLVGEGKLFGNTLYLGLERQAQFEHFGLFLGAGLQGSVVNYKGDINFPEENPILDYTYKRRTLGPAIQSTMYTNITDNLYIYLTSSFSMYYLSSNANQDFGDNEQANYNGFDTNMILLDAVGLAYKF